MKAADRALVVRSVGGLLAAASCFAATCLAQPANCPAPSHWPAKMRLEYDVTASRGPLAISGESIVEFERDGARYSIAADTAASVLYHARQTSRGTIEAAGLRPDEFVETRSGRGTATTTFDWGAKSVTFSAAPGNTTETRPGLQDRATLSLQVAWLHRAAPAAPFFDVVIAGARSVGETRFVRQGEEKVGVPAGSVATVRFERPADADHDRIEAWLSADWCGLPVRVRYTDKNGGVIDHRLRAGSVLP